MRLWHQKLIPYLPRQQLLGQHRECAALRGKGWGKKHATVDYVSKDPPVCLIAYHWLIMDEMEKRGYHPDPIWRNTNWRGTRLGEQIGWVNDDTVNNHLFNVRDDSCLLYLEHDGSYLEEGNQGASCECHMRQCPMMNIPFASPNSTNLSARVKSKTPSSGWISSDFMQFSATMLLKCFFIVSTPLTSAPVIWASLSAAPM